MLTVILMLSIMVNGGKDAPAVLEAPKVRCVNCVCGDNCKCETEGACLKPKVSSLNYAEGTRAAKKSGLPLITFVGANPDSSKEYSGYVVCVVKGLDGYQSGDKITSKWVDGQHIRVKIEGPSSVPTTIVVPEGQHAHITVDGRTIVHGNENLGSAPAHAGIAPPWYRTGEAGQTIQWCPSGNCPRR